MFLSEFGVFVGRTDIEILPYDSFNPGAVRYIAVLYAYSRGTDSG